MQRASAGVALLAALWPALGSAQQPGEQVAIVEQAPIKAGRKVLEMVGPGTPLRVRQRRGQWLAVANGQPGWIHRSHVLPLEEAIDHFSDEIERRRDSARLYVIRGVLLNAQDKPAEAIADFSEAIERNPKLRAAYANRAIAWKARGEYAIAIRDYNEAIRLDPQHGRTWHNRGNAWLKLGREEKAVSDFREAIRLAPEAFDGYNALAWLQATSSKQQLRDAESALENAKKACRLCDYGRWYCLSTLAAAHAAEGHFDQAVRWAEQAREMAPAEDREQLEELLSVYRSGRPYRGDSDLASAVANRK